MAKTYRCRRCGTKKDTPGRKCFACSMKERAERFDAALDIEEPMAPTVEKSAYLPIVVQSITPFFDNGGFVGFVGFRASVWVENPQTLQPTLCCNLVFGRDDRSDAPYNTSMTIGNIALRVEKDLREWYVRKFGTDGIRTAQFSFDSSNRIRFLVENALNQMTPNSPSPEPSGPETMVVSGVTLTGYGLDNLQLVLSPSQSEFALYLKNPSIPVKVLSVTTGSMGIQQIEIEEMEALFAARSKRARGEASLGPPPPLTKVTTSEAVPPNTTWWLSKDVGSIDVANPRMSKQIFGLFGDPPEEDPAEARRKYENTVSEFLRRQPEFAEKAKALMSRSPSAFTPSEIEAMNAAAERVLRQERDGAVTAIESTRGIVNLDSQAFMADTIRKGIDKAQDRAGLARDGYGAYTVDFGDGPKLIRLGEEWAAQSKAAMLKIDPRKPGVRIAFSGLVPGSTAPTPPTPTPAPAFPAVQPTEFTRLISLEDD